VSALKIAMEAVRYIVDQKPEHTKKGRLLDNVTDAQVVNSLLSEANELHEAVVLNHKEDAIPYEAADVLIPIFHLSKRRGWCEEDLARWVIEKLMLRHHLSEEQKAHMTELLARVVAADEVMLRVAVALPVLNLVLTRAGVKDIPRAVGLLTELIADFQRCFPEVVAEAKRRAEQKEKPGSSEA